MVYLEFRAFFLPLDPHPWWAVWMQQHLIEPKDTHLTAAIQTANMYLYSLNMKWPSEATLLAFMTMLNDTTHSLPCKCACRVRTEHSSGGRCLDHLHVMTRRFAEVKKRIMNIKLHCLQLCTPYLCLLLATFCSADQLRTVATFLCGCSVLCILRIFCAFTCTYSSSCLLGCCFDSR